MMRHTITPAITAMVIGALLLSGCKTTRQTALQQPTVATQPGTVHQHKGQPSVQALPPTIIYKTRADYSQLVPVGLSADRSRVTSYPAPADIRRSDGSFATPIQLAHGYLLDRRGIHAHSAFTSYTYAEYAALSAPPGLTTLLEKIVDADPFIEIWNCGTAPITIESLNLAITNQHLDSLYTRIK